MITKRPTEGKYSMMSFVIKGFLPQENGSTIMMPADTIVYAGEDFDKLCVEVKPIELLETPNR